jgi:hypothetical protein
LIQAGPWKGEQAGHKTQNESCAPACWPPAATPHRDCPPHMVDEPMSLFGTRERFRESAGSGDKMRRIGENGGLVASESVRVRLPHLGG